MDTKYLDITNVVTTEDLYQALINKIEPIINEETERRKPFETEYNEQIKPFVEAYNQTVEVDEELAKMKLQPHKTKMDAEVKDLTDRFNKKIDKKIKWFASIQGKIQAEFDKKTVAPKAKFDEAIKPFKEEFEAKEKVMIAELEERIKPINAEYRELAEKMEEALGQKNDQEAS